MSKHSKQDMIKTEDMSFQYVRRDENDRVIAMETALDHINVEIKKGEFIAVLGRNGSGKSTFAKHVNAIFSPTEGTMYVDGLDTSDMSSLVEIRRRAGMVFQNPDDQIIATRVDEDVAFGPENLGVEPATIRQRVRSALESVGMLSHSKDDPGRLSGGQKQRVAIAGVMAMLPECIVLDEPTAMLDPEGRADVMKTIMDLNRENGITIILITHYMDEAARADKVIVMDKGKVACAGKPAEVFSHRDELKAMGLEVPFAVEAAQSLRQRGEDIPEDVLDVEELAVAMERSGLLDRLDSMVSRNASDKVQDEKVSELVSAALNPPASYTAPGPAELKSQSSLILDHVGYVYSPGTVYQHEALKDINLTFTRGEFVVIAGHTGSGKSTLALLLDGLNKATSGHVYYNGMDVSDRDFKLRDLRSHVGICFQYPDNQLFEETVIKDVCFGPGNLGWDKIHVEKSAYDAIKAVGLPDTCYDDSPFQMSGGQKRRVAIAGVLAMEPEYLVLDEPTAGLDPAGRREILDMLKSLCRDKGLGIILISHSMDDAAEYADRLIIMDDGRVLYNDMPEIVFSHRHELLNASVGLPDTGKLAESAAALGHTDLKYMIRQDQMIDLLCAAAKGGNAL